MKYLLGLFFVFISLGSWAQSNEELATYYYQNQEYEKALLYLEDIYKQKPNDTYFQFYLISLKNLERYEEAQDLVEKHLKKNRGRLELEVELGQLMSLNGKPEKAQAHYDKAIEEAGVARHQVINLANAFIQDNLLKEAKRTYDQGRKNATDGYPYSYELASLYGAMGDDARMIDEYMELIGYNQGYVQTVQNNLSRVFDFSSDDARVEMLKSNLLKKVQSQAEACVL
jgi:tetratricopeptide (TPR) repeat protein